MTGPPAASADVLTRTAWTALGGDPAALQQLRIHGQTAGLLPSRHAAMPAMAAAVACAVLAVAETDTARTGTRSGAVDIDAVHVAVAARSETHARVHGQEDQDDLFAPLSRFWGAADGWVRLHANYPWHKQRALSVLGCADDPESVARAIASRSADGIEEAFAAADALAFKVRTAEEWLRHAHGRAVAALPLVETRYAAAADRQLPPGRGLEGIRVLDMTRVIAGPVATRTLAAWGADVLRIDSPRLPEIEAQTVDTLPGKRSALLDCADPDGRDRLEALLGQADVLVQGYRPGALAAFGLDAGPLGARHPHLTVVTLSAWGRSGPWSGRRGFDSLVQCPTGIAAAESADGVRPGALPAQVLDHATGYLAAAAAALSLARTAVGGPPTHAWLSLAQTARWLQSAGTTAPAATQPGADPAPYLVELPGHPSGGVTVVGPPGRAGDLIPRWTATTRFGADLPGFGPAEH